MDALRRKINGAFAEEHSTSSVPADIWQNAVQTGRVARALDGSEDNVNQLIAYVLDVYPIWNKVQESTDEVNTRVYTLNGTKPASLRAELDEDEQLQAKCLTEYLTVMMSCIEDVRNIRYFAGGLLAINEVDAFITSDVIRFLGPAELMEEGIPEQQKWSEVRGNFQLSKEFISGGIHWQMQNGSYRNISYAGMSLLEKLHALSRSLAQNYGWEEQDMIRFVLTGDLAINQPFTMHAQLLSSFHKDVGAFRLGVITLTVSPWISAKTVLANYRRAQRVLFQTSRYGFRPLHHRKLLLFRFIVSQMKIVESPNGVDKAVELPEWETLRSIWNNDHPTERYDFSGNFKAAWDDALTSILMPPYRTPDT